MKSLNWFYVPQTGFASDFKSKIQIFATKSSQKKVPLLKVTQENNTRTSTEAQINRHLWLYF